MTSETKAIHVAAYRDGAGRPTCAIDFAAGLVCEFYRTQRLGCSETCVFAAESGKYFTPLARRDNGHGTLIPCKECPVWRKETK